MIFAYLKIAEKITHVDAFARPNLLSKRMGNKVPNGNIIVDSTGGYNRFDGWAHWYKFDKIKKHYAVGDETASRMLTAKEIQSLAPQFVSTLSSIVGVSGSRAIDIISRKGRILTARQVQLLLGWLRRPTLRSTGPAANSAAGRLP